MGLSVRPPPATMPITNEGGGEVSGWVGCLIQEKVEEETVVRMSYCGLLGGGWVGR